MSWLAGAVPPALAMKGDLALAAIALLLGAIAWNVQDNLAAHAIGVALAVLGVWLAVESLIDRRDRRARNGRGR
jgi:hypothetical protein